MRTLLRFLRMKLLPKKLKGEVREAVFTEVASNSEWSMRFFILLGLSTVIASLGLVSNSAAVVIGAMIIAPLMSPILGVALATVSGATVLQRKALALEFVGVLLVIGLGFLVGQVPFTLGISSEMLARTAPTTYDIVIAVACGLAGGYGSVNPKANAAAGVAISVALVPPLSSCGLLLAYGEMSLALGALMLFLANFFSIQLAASMVFLIYGFAGDQINKKGLIILRLTPSIVGVLLVGVFLTATLMRLFSDRQLEESLRSALSEQVARRTGGRLEEILRRELKDQEYVVVARILSPKPFNQQQVSQMQDDLRKNVRPDIRLILRSVVSEDMSADGRVFLTETEMEQAASAEDQAKSYKALADTLREGLAAHEGAALDEMTREVGNDVTRITAIVRTPTPIEAYEVKALEEMIYKQTGTVARLTVRSVSTRDVDRTGLIFQPEKPREDPRLEAVRNRLRPILERRLAPYQARLTGIGVTPKGERFIAQANVLSPQPIPTAELGAMVNDIRRFVDYRIDLQFRVDLFFGG